MADLWGGGVIASPEQLNEKRPVAPIDLTPNLNAPILGLFGNDDMSPSPDQVNQHEAALKEHGKTYHVPPLRWRRARLLLLSGTSYRPQAAMDGWNKVEDWFKQYLA